MRFRPVSLLARGLQKVGRQDRRNNTMKSLALLPILSNLAEAHGELARLFARIQFVVFGEVVDKSVKGWAENVARDEKTSPLDERALFVSLFHAYRHLNFAWNGRHESEERVRRCDPTDVARWSKFPENAVFRDLWPPPSQCHGTPSEPGRGHVAPTPFRRHSFKWPFESWTSSATESRAPTERIHQGAPRARRDSAREWKPNPSRRRNSAGGCTASTPK